MLASLRLAVQFLTRIPVPSVKGFQPAMLTRAAGWFPLVGLLIGVLLGFTLWLASFAGTLLAGAVVLVVWVWVTGALHLDGLADLADARAAAHANPARFHEVLKDPRVGTFAVVSLLLVGLLKFAALASLAPQLDEGLQAAALLVLVPAWARLGALDWITTVPPLASGSGERFAWAVPRTVVYAWLFALGALSAWLAPAALAAIPCILGWRWYLRHRVGGQTGDCLGAGIEVVETAALVLGAMLLAGSG